MTEKVQRLVMRAFRGVPSEMLVDFGKGDSLVVYGDNGTGKSTIADALEWYFTGAIEFLSHEGRQHAVRHVSGGGKAAKAKGGKGKGAKAKAQDDDANGSGTNDGDGNVDGAGDTFVEVATNGALGGKVVFPDARQEETFRALRRETFLLRGRTLADFINKTKTEKWKALVEILGLDSIENIREDLQKARNELRKIAKSAEEEARTLGSILSPDADAKTVTHESVLDNLQQICGMLQVEPPLSIDQVVDPLWLTTAVGARATTSSASSDRDRLLSEIGTLRAPALETGAFDAWNALVSSDRARMLSRASLVREAKRLFETKSIEAGHCPLCGQKVSEKTLARRIESVLTEVIDASRDLDAVRDPVAQLADDLDVAAAKRRSIHDRARAHSLELTPPPSLGDASLHAALDALNPIDIDAVTRYLSDVREWDQTASASATAQNASTPAAPEPQSRDTQLVMLAALCQQVNAWRLAEKKAARANRALDLAESVFEAYQQKQKDDLAELLTTISRRVAEIYSALHPGEQLDGVSVEPWTAKGVELAIQFHGSRQRPPHGVLSESHLNSLAIALFLAMAEAFNEHLGFLVLDDVINSFDVEHRGRLAELLADGFGDWQLIVLTHDQQFFEHLSRRAPSWRKLEFTSWSHATGPRTTRYDGNRMLAEAQERLASGDVHGAAAKARRALEELLQEVCEALGAPLPFRRGQANDKRELGELFMGLRRCLKDRAKPMLEIVEPLLKHLEADVGATLNVAVHGSRGRTAASEVEATLKRISALDEQWSCPSCRTRVWHRGNAESGRCKCGESSFPPARVGLAR